MNMAKVFRTSVILAAAVSAGLFPVTGYCLPDGASPEAGSAVAFDSSVAKTLKITAADQAVINYAHFNIAADETVTFIQPSSGATCLNRVTGDTNPSQILGKLSANGRIFLINPNGIVFGAASRVDAVGLVASTLDISSADFRGGNYHFLKNGGNGYIINNGQIKIGNGGFVCLLAGAVDNRNLIQVQASLGKVVLASGEEMTLVHLDDVDQISVAVSKEAGTAVFGPGAVRISDAIANSGTIQAAGGKVILTAKSLNAVFDHAINNALPGLVEANTLVAHAGVVELTGKGADIQNDGLIGAGSISITTDKNFTNGVFGDIYTDGGDASYSPDGGNITINADDVLQQGWISSNSASGGNAGVVDIIAAGDLVIEGTSNTQARATGVSGNGGDVNLSYGGDITVDSSATVTVAGGGKTGNSGSIVYKEKSSSGSGSGTNQNAGRDLSNILAGWKAILFDAGRGRTPYVPFDGLGTPYLYHPLTPVDASAFNNFFALEEGAYSYIDGMLQMMGHDDLSAWLGGIRR